MNRTVSVCLVQWGKTDLTVRAVAAVARSQLETVEILVYDNASPGGPGPVADRADVILVEGEDNIGFGPAHNRLAARATGDLLLILNNDTVVEPRAIGRLVDRYLAGDRPGAVTPQYRDFDGRTLEMGGFLGSGGDGWQLFRGERPPPSLQRMSYRSQYGSGACLLVGRDDFLRLGGFDDLFAPAYYEDTDLCLKLESEGRPTVVEPGAVVYHYEGATAGRDLNQGPKAYQLRNRTRFVQRWQDRLAPLGPIDFGAAVTHALAPPAPDGRRVLWLSPHLPRPDREAGHQRIVKMIEALQADGDLVALWAEHLHDADEYGRRLERMGVPWFGTRRDHRWGVAPETALLSTAHDLLRTVPWDVVVISFPELASRLIPVVRQLRPEAAVVVDDVDLHFLRQERARAAGIEVFEVISKARELATYGASDGVITASDLESELLADLLPGLPTWTFTVAAEEPVEPVTVGETLLFLGNFNHHPNVDAVEWWLSEVGPAVQRHTGAPLPLRIIGAGSDARRSAWETAGAGMLSVAGWVPELGPEFDRARVFVAPLRYGAGTKGKILAALAHGVPVVTTSVGAEGNHDEVLAGLVVRDDPESLAEAVATLMTDDAAWKEQRELAARAGRAAWERQRALTDEFAAWVHRRARHHSA